MARLVIFCLGFTVVSQCFLFIQCTHKMFITDVVDGKIFVGENRGTDFHGEDIREIPLSGVGAPTGIDYDYRTDKIYWSDAYAMTINRASLDGSNQEILIDQSQGIGYPQGIVLDLMTSRIFWTDTLLEQIVSASLLGSNRRTIISTDLYRPWGIVLSQRRGKLYWTDEGISTGKIGMSNKDGSDRRQLVTARLREPRGLALDSQEKRLYWTESYYDVIESIDLDDLSDRREHVYAESGDVVVFGISLYFTSIYFTDLASGGLYEADIGVEEIRNITGFTAGAPSHVKIYAGITCTLPNPPPMASFHNPRYSYSASTTVAVTCDNGNDQAEWICNGYTGNWDEEPIDCSDPPIILSSGLAGGAVFFLLLLGACIYWRKCKPQRSSVAAPVRSAVPPPTVVYTAGAQPGVVTVPSGATAYPGQYPGQYPGMQPGAPSPYFTNPRN